MKFDKTHGLADESAEFVVLVGLLCLMFLAYHLDQVVVQQRLLQHSFMTPTVAMTKAQHCSTKRKDESLRSIFQSPLYEWGNILS